MSTADPAGLVTVEILPSQKPGVAAWRSWTSVALADATVGFGPPETDSIRRPLNLSVKTVPSPIELCAQPSGTLIVNALLGGEESMYAWVSGMSPAGFTSDV